MKLKHYTCGILVALGLAIVIVAPSAEAPPEPIPAPVGVRTDEMLALCREVYGPQSTVITNANGMAACDTRVPKVAAR